MVKAVSAFHGFFLPSTQQILSSSMGILKDSCVASVGRSISGYSVKEQRHVGVEGGRE